MAQFPMQRIGITAGYGPYTVNGQRKPHYGADICSQSNGNVVACHAGKVVLSCYDSAGGNMIALQGSFNDKRDIITRYAHLASRKVGVGQTVYEGQLIGIQGATGSACFGRHLHLETWLVPKGYTYNYAGRVNYSVDPLSVLHVIDGQTFIVDSDTLYNDGIPYPEPKPLNLAACGLGAKVKVLNGNVRMRLIPFTGYTPLTSGGSDRAIDTLAEFCPGVTEFEALYRCTSTTAGVTNEWAGINTPYGLFWVALLAGYTELIDPLANVTPTTPATPTEGDAARIAELEKRIASLAAQTILYKDRIDSAVEILTEE